MLSIRIGRQEHGCGTVLCLGAHSDDIEIGCGGSILYLTRSCPEVQVYWVVLSSGAERAAEAERSSERFLAGVSRKEIVIKDFRTSYFPFVGAEIKDFFEELKGRVEPDVVFTHCRGDLHQDHRLTCELTWNTFRDHLVLEYEIPKYDADLGSPNVFVPLEQELAMRKIDYLFECFKSQTEKTWFKRDYFLSLMRLRGLEINAASGLAEAFYCRKAAISLG